MASAAKLKAVISDLYDADDIAVFSPNRAIAPISFASLIGFKSIATGMLSQIFR